MFLVIYSIVLKCTSITADKKTNYFSNENFIYTEVVEVMAVVFIFTNNDKLNEEKTVLTGIVSEDIIHPPAFSYLYRLIQFPQKRKKYWIWILQ